MKKRSFIILLAVTVFVAALAGTGSAANPVPPSNETSSLYVEISATSIGSLTAHTDLTYAQGNGDLNDNPPLESGEGVATIGYYEDTYATSGSIAYNQNIYVDTSSQTQPQNNLETERSIDYSNEGDGDGMGRMYSAEAVMIDECSTASTSQQDGCCPWGGTSEGEILPASCVMVITGSEVDLKEGSVNSESSARTTSSDVDEGVQVSYSVDVDGSGQTGNEAAEGTATVYVDAVIMEGSGNETNQTTDMSYEQSVSVDGLIEISMRTGYSSP
ncbi:MAG: hypothetical protein LUQ33_07985 [Methanoregulaceae archaeon]|nr:hypothetical protein [Methanoregulaceae archaeon]